MGLLVRYAFLYHSSTVIAPADQVPLAPQAFGIIYQLMTSYWNNWRVEIGEQKLTHSHRESTVFIYSGSHLLGQRQPSETPLKNTFKYIGNV